jgi:hypothetical protein
MSTSYSPKIVTDGLVFIVDAANRKSYPGSGTNWNSLNDISITGSLNNGPTFNGANGGSIVFDGTNQQVGFGDPVSLQITNNLSVFAWTKIPPDTPSSPFDKGIVTKYITGTQRSWTMHTSNVDPYDKFQLFLSDGTNAKAINTTTVIRTDTWIYVGFTFVSNVAVTYINGLPVSSSNGSATVVNTLGITNVPLHVGGRSTTNYLSGSVATVHIYNRALSANEVLQNFNATRGRFGV